MPSYRQRKKANEQYWEFLDTSPSLTSYLKSSTERGGSKKHGSSLAHRPRKEKLNIFKCGRLRGEAIPLPPPAPNDLRSRRDLKQIHSLTATTLSRKGHSTFTCSPLAAASRRSRSEAPFSGCPKHLLPQCVATTWLYIPDRATHPPTSARLDWLQICMRRSSG